MKLRRWQAQSIERAYTQYRANSRHFMCLATPGAGKTVMASILARRLFDACMIDMVLCFSPSIVVAEDFRRELEERTGKRLNGHLGSGGCSLTYQAMSTLDSSFWKILDNHRVFVIFDEIHHCAAVDEGKSNSWGETIYRFIRGKSAYSLALTGTPWRSDNIPIVLSDYCKDSGKVHCDFRYGLGEAVLDGVCREPRITVIDNSQIRVTTGAECNSYSSFEELLSLSDCGYQDLLENEILIAEVIRRAGRKLDLLRERDPNAGGLIVATSVSHAQKIARILRADLNETAEIATYAESNPVVTIRRFRDSTSKWIISVGMISEGTNLPRLQVCCYLTRVKTELYFRQVLGRILRVTDQSTKVGHLFMPAEPILIEYAKRISEDIPDSNIVTFESAEFTCCVENGFGTLSIAKDDKYEKPNIEIYIDRLANESILPIGKADLNSTLAKSYEDRINVSEYFYQKLVEIGRANLE